MTGLPRPRWNAPLHAAAGTVADALLRNYAAGTPGIPAVDQPSWDSLRAQIMMDPVYAPSAAGLVGTLLRSEYPHDG